MFIRKLSLFFCALALLTGGMGCLNTSDRLLDAGTKLAMAITVSDAQLQQDAAQMREQGDKQNQLAPAGNNYAQRLEKLTRNLKNEDGLKLNFKVYLTSDINANATPDGSIRVYSGLMDMMTDDELFFIIGHEIGHVKNGDALDAMRVAYTVAGVRSGVGAAHYSAAILSDSVLGELLEAVLNAQFSQSQESSADIYGYQLLLKYKRNPQAGVSALQKLGSLGAGGGFLSSHPDSFDRAQAIADKIAAAGK